MGHLNYLNAALLQHISAHLSKFKSELSIYQILIIANANQMLGYTNVCIHILWLHVIQSTFDSLISTFICNYFSMIPLDYIEIVLKYLICIHQQNKVKPINSKVFASLVATIMHNQNQLDIHILFAVGLLLISL